MKKIEAKALAPEKSKLVIEYITQILSNSEKVNSVMDFWYRWSEYVYIRYLCT